MDETSSMSLYANLDPQQQFVENPAEVDYDGLGLDDAGFDNGQVVYYLPEGEQTGDEPTDVSAEVSQTTPEAASDSQSKTPVGFQQAIVAVPQADSTMPVESRPASNSYVSRLNTDAIFEVKPDVATAFNGLAVQNTYVKIQKTMLSMLQGMATRTDGEIAQLRRQLFEAQDRARTERYRLEDGIASLERRVLELERKTVSETSSSVSNEEQTRRTSAVSSSPEIGRRPTKRGGFGDPNSLATKSLVDTVSDARPEDLTERPKTSGQSLCPNVSEDASSGRGLARNLSEDGGVQTRRRKRAKVGDTTESNFSLSRSPKDDFEKLLLKVLVGKNDTYVGRVFMLPLLEQETGSPGGFLLNIRMLRFVAKLLYPETFLVFPRGGLKPVSIDFLRNLLLEFGAKRAPDYLVTDPSVRPFAIKEPGPVAADNWLRLPVGFLFAAEVATGRQLACAPTRDKVEHEIETFYGRKGAWPPRRSLDSVLNVRMPPEDESLPEDAPSPFAGPLRSAAETSRTTQSFAGTGVALPRGATSKGEIRQKTNRVISENVGTLTVVRHLGPEFNAAMGYPDLSEPTHYSGPWPVSDLPILETVRESVAIALERLSTVPFAPVKKSSGKKSSAADSAKGLSKRPVRALPARSKRVKPDCLDE
jgi:hypothetical protein